MSFFSVFPTYLLDHEDKQFALQPTGPEERHLTTIFHFTSQVAQVDAYTNADQLSRTGQQNGNLKATAPPPAVTVNDVRNTNTKTFNSVKSLVKKSGHHVGNSELDSMLLL